MLTQQVSLMTIFYASMALLFSGCSKKPINHRTGSQQLALYAPQRLSSTKHFDIPTPLTFILTKTIIAKTGVSTCDSMRYTGRLSIEKTIDFYTREMERSGWNIINLSDKQEGFLYCHKPTKTCGISVRKESTNAGVTTVALFVKQDG